MTRVWFASIVVGLFGVASVGLHAAHAVGRMPGGIALSPYGSSPQAVSPVPASIAFAGENK